jgi:hypothetical protein
MKQVDGSDLFESLFALALEDRPVRLPLLLVNLSQVVVIGKTLQQIVQSDVPCTVRLDREPKSRHHNNH